MQRLFWFFAAALLPAGGACAAVKLSFLDPQGPVASAQRGYLIAFCLLLTIVVLPVLVLTPLIAWRYRYRNRSAPYRPRWSFSWPLEIVVWGVPFAIVVVLAVWLWRGTHALDPYAPIASARPPLQVNVVGYDWKWLFIYPQLGIASIGQFAFPADRPLAIELTSNTVMQSFFIPALGSQIYAMAGMVTKLNLKANGAGRFRGENTQYNGNGFHRQKFTAVAMTPANFAAWSARAKAHGIPMTAAAYKAIRQRATAEQTRKALRVEAPPDGAITFSGVSPDLFNKIVRSFHGGSADAAVLVGAKAVRAGAVTANRRRAAD
ncbi:MAG: cytochrome ubiquinol oxidase subunit II [Pseudolabrys sp.]